MATAQQLVEQNGDLPNEKLTSTYLPMHEVLLPMFTSMVDAEIRRELRGAYLMVIFDEISTIPRRYIDVTRYTALLMEWQELETKFGALYSRPMLLSAEEWGSRKRALIAMREAIGMGTTAPSSGRDLAEPIRMAEFHRFCTPNCPKAKELKSSHRRFQ